jgi:hypothetical protein
MLATRPRPDMVQRAIQGVQTVLPPVRGLNSTGAVAAMPETDAVAMDNFISTDLGLAIREGWREYATNIGGDATSAVRTVLAYNGATDTTYTSPLTSSTLFAAVDSGIWNIEGGGNMAAAPAAIALSGNLHAGYLSYVMFTTDSGQYLVACSETDGGFLYNGAAWLKMTNVGGPGPGIITGVDPADFVHVVAWKKRLMFTQRGTARVWILDVGAVGGVALEFDFGPQLQNGGSVIGLANWTQDDGAGVDDRLVILGSAGDLVIYQGNDPTDPAQFAAMGQWFIGQPPVGRRCFTAGGGNVYVLTSYGVIPVNQVVQGGLDNILTSDTQQLSQLRKIESQLNNDFNTLLNTPGWELLEIPSKALLHIARPSISVSEHIQYAFQQHALAWSRLLDVPARTFGRRLNETYGGTEDARVLRVFDGYTDGKKLDGTGAMEVRARLTPAFSYFGNPGVQKQALMIRLNFVSSAAPGYSVVMNVDFAVTPLGGVAVAGGAVGSLWDLSYWDEAIWSGGQASFAEWRGIEGLGYALAPSIFTSATVKTVLASIEYMLKQGGPL